MTTPERPGGSAPGPRPQAPGQQPAPSWDEINLRFARLASAGAFEEARALLEGAAGRDDAPPALQYNLGKVLMKLGRAPEAGPWFQRSAKGDPAYPPTWFELGRWHSARREFAEAASAFREAARLMPNDPDSRRLAGRCALAGRDWAAAAEAFRELRRLVPGDEEGLIKGYRAACELRSREAEELRAEILGRPELRGPLLNATIRASAGRLPLRPLAGTRQPA